MNLIEYIRRQMNTDDDDDDARQSAYLRRAYESADPSCRAKLDEAFIALCGWSLATLLAKAEAA
jgi:hypothetical protein